ncbi:hypothetical protein, partial [Nocardia tenerifensis]|uniref:hypothetical protein n=1 Tax=Nocardia tenerifensis TaxID=228006 RepID=UPI00059311B4
MLFTKVADCVQDADEQSSDRRELAVGPPSAVDGFVDPVPSFGAKGAIPQPILDLHQVYSLVLSAVESVPIVARPTSVGGSLC